MRLLALLLLAVVGCYDDGPDASSPAPATSTAAYDASPPLDDSADPPDAAPPEDAASFDATRDARDDVRADDAAPDGACAHAPAPGDLAIDEILIASVAGTGDHGEWLEVRSTADCAIDLRGLHGECPRGSKVATFDVADTTWLPPRGRFVVADSANPAINHDLPGLVLVWLGEPGDVLRNQGATITLRLGSAVIDSVTYPALPATIGASLAFPEDCDLATRGDWARWRTSTAAWFPGFHGTPNAPNGDVACR